MDKKLTALELVGEVKSFIREMGTLGSYGYGCIWLNYYGNCAKCDYHVIGARDILTRLGYACPDKIEDIYPLMYGEGYARVTLEKNQIQVEYGGTELSRMQISELKNLAIENNKPVYNTDTDRLLFSPFKS